MLTTLHRLIADDAGAELAEYCLLASFVAVVALVAVGALGRQVLLLFTGGPPSAVR